MSPTVQFHLSPDTPVLYAAQRVVPIPFRLVIETAGIRAQMGPIS
jgi:hypothetical protein